MAEHLQKGAKVEWTWGAHTGHGTIREVFTRRVSRTIKGKKIIRNGTPEEPAYLIVEPDGAKVLKSESELRRD